VRSIQPGTLGIGEELLHDVVEGGVDVVGRGVGDGGVYHGGFDLGGDEVGLLRFAQQKGFGCGSVEIILGGDFHIVDIGNLGLVDIEHVSPALELLLTGLEGEHGLDAADHLLAEFVGFDFGIDVDSRRCLGIRNGAAEITMTSCGLPPPQKTAMSLHPLHSTEHHSFWV